MVRYSSQLIIPKIKRKISWCESQSGFDGRILIKKPYLAKKLKQAGFRYPRIAWDWGIKEYDKIKKQLHILFDVGYGHDDIFVFMIYNWKISFEEMEEKRIKCWEWRTQISDCRYRPLTQTFDYYNPYKSQTSKDYFIYETEGWTDAKVKQFRRNVRRQNICSRQGVSFYSSNFERMKSKKKDIYRTRKMGRGKTEKFLDKLKVDYWFPDDITYPDPEKSETQDKVLIEVSS